MTNSPDFGIPYIAQSQSQPEVTHNDALNRVQIMLSGAIDKDLSTPPVSPTEGDVYIVGSSATGDWSGHDNKLAGYFGTSWLFVPGNDSDGSPISIGARHEGLKMWVKDEDALYVWSGTAWGIYPST